MKALAISNKIKVVNTDPSFTRLVTFGDTRYVFNINYPEMPDFTQQVRLFLKIWKPRQQEAGQQYRDNIGVYQNNNVIIDKIVDIETDYFDANAHIALTIASKHAIFMIDGKSYFRNSEYEINWDDSPGDTLQLAPAKATFIEQGKGLTNQSC